MYEQYLSMPAVPAGAILKRILQKENLSQKEIAKKTAIYPQRINDLINGKRKFNPEYRLIMIFTAIMMNRNGNIHLIYLN